MAEQGVVGGSFSSPSGGRQRCCPCHRAPAASGPREILTDELAAFLVAQENEKDLADAIARMDQAPVKVESRHYRQFLTENVIPQFEAL
jgi:hypothetical protein